MTKMPRKSKAKSINGTEIPTRVVPPSRDMPVTFETIRNPAILQEIKEYALQGCTMEQIAGRLLVTKQTLYQWTKKYQEVRDVILEGKRVADDRVEQSLYDLCFPHDEKEITIEKDENDNIVKTTIRTKHIPANVTAIQYWLQNRRRDEWKNQQTHEFTGSSAVPVQIVYDLQSKDKPALSNEGSED